MFTLASRPRRSDDMNQNRKNFEQDKYQNVEGILEIGKDGLCHRCGGCVGICPANTLALNSDCYPYQIGECTSCSLCTDICSGAFADFQDMGSQLFGDDYHRDTPLGILQQVYVGHSTDEGIRWAGASGGVVTNFLAHLLESEEIQGAIVVGPNPEDPAQGLGYIARNREELLPSSQSRYTTAPLLHTLKEIAKDKDGSYAVVALPCHVHTLRKLQKKSKAWRKRIRLLIGLYCHYRLPHEATREVGEILAPPGSRLERIKYRQKDNQGWSKNTVEMTFSDGSRWRSPYGPAQTVSLLAHCYPRGRCMYCIDALAEFADIAIGDPWIRGKDGQWKYFVPGGRSGIIIRTDVGNNLLHGAVNAGALEISPIPGDEVLEGQHLMIMEKFTGTPLRMQWFGYFGRSLPEYGVAYPRANFGARLREGRFLLLRIVTIFGPVRRFFVRLGFSKPGRMFMKFRRNLNKKRAISRLTTTQK